MSENSQNKNVETAETPAVGQTDCDQKADFLPSMIANIAEISSDVIIIHDLEGRILYANPKMTELCGYPADALLCSNIIDFVSADDLPQIAERKRRRDNGNPELHIYEVSFRQKDGSCIPFEVRSSLIINTGTDPVVLVIGRDISERKAQTLKLKKQSVQLRERIKELDCLYQISTILSKPHLSLTMILNEIVEIIPRGWQFPEIGCARIRFESREFRSGNFRETVWKQSTPITADGSVLGTLDFCYIEDPLTTHPDQEIFIPEEDQLLNSISERLSETILRKQSENRLKESEERNRLLVDLAMDGIFIENLKGEILDCNSVGCQMFGYSREEMLTLRIHDLVPEEFAETLPDTITEDWTTGNRTLERWNVKKDGTVFPTEIHSKIFKVNDESRLIVYVRDISERKRAEAALRESEERYRGLFENSALGIYQTKPDGEIVVVNSSLLQMLGYETLQELRQRNLEQDGFEPEYPRKRFKSRMERDGYVRGLESVWHKKDGTPLYIRETAKAIRDSRGNIVYYEGTVEDISDKKLAAKVVRDSQERFKRAIVEAPFPLMIHAEDGEILQFSKTWSELTGYHPEEIPDTISWLKKAYGKNYGKVKAVLDRVYRAPGKVQLGEYEISARDGRQIVWDFSTAPLGTLPDGRKLVLSMAVDVTDRKQAEAKIKELNAALEGRVRERTRELQEANKELEAFAYSVSHDLRAPLRHIDGFVSLLIKHSREQMDDKSRRYLDTIARAARQMGRLIDDLLIFSRTGRQEMTRHPVDLNAVVSQIRRESESETAGQAIEWQIEKLPVVGGDLPMLRVVFNNLVQNALKYSRTRPVSKIRIGSLPGNGAGPVIFVRDNGVGFDMKYQHKLFGVFQRLHTDEQFEGTGIGLATVRRIVNRHGGRIWAEAEPDKGATFYMELKKM